MQTHDLQISWKEQEMFSKSVQQNQGQWAATALPHVCVIKLAEAMPLCNCINPLSTKETQATEEYIKESHKYGTICNSNPPESTRIFYLKKIVVAYDHQLL